MVNDEHRRREDATLASISVPIPIQVRAVVLPTMALSLGVVAWWVTTELIGVPSFLLPSPAAVAAQFTDSPGLYLQNALYTLEKIVYGGVTGIVAGFILALFVTTVRPLRRAIYPYLVTLRVLPKLTIAPVLLIYLGIGFRTAVVFVALVTFFPMVVSTVAGLDNTPESYLNLLESVDAGPLRTFLSVRLPYALPDVFAGLKQSVALAVVGAVVAEWIVADKGLGFLVLFAFENVQTDVMVAALVVLFVEGWILYGAVGLVQRFVLWGRTAQYQ